MFIILLMIGLGTLLIVLTIRTQDSDDKEWAIGITIGYWVAFIVVSLTIVLFNKIDINKMNVFYEVDRVNFEKVITETLSYIEPKNVTSLGVEKFEVYRVVSDRLSELTIQIKEYNSRLAGYRILKENLFTNWYIPSLDRLEYIKLDLPALDK